MKVEEYVPCLLLAMLTDDQAKGSDPASKWVLFTDRRQNLLVQEQWCYYFHTCVLWIDLSENSGVSIFILVYSESLSPLKGSLLYKGFELLIRSFCLNLSVFHLALLWEVYCRACVASGGDSSKTSDWPGLQWAVRWNGKYATKAHFCLFNLYFWKCFAREFTMTSPTIPDFWPVSCSCVRFWQWWEGWQYGWLPCVGDGGACNQAVHQPPVSSPGFILVIIIASPPLLSRRHNYQITTARSRAFLWWKIAKPNLFRNNLSLASNGQRC